MATAHIMPAAHNLFIALPDELVLYILGHLVLEPRYDRDAYRALTSLALAHARFIELVRETLQKNTFPTIALCNTHALVRTLLASPESSKKVTGLEITNFASKDTPADTYTTPIREVIGSVDTTWRLKAQGDLAKGVRYNTAKNQSNVPSAVFDINFDSPFRKNCEKIIRGSSTTPSDKRKWTSALLKGRSAAFLALLLIVIPNPPNLSLSASHVLQYPMLFIPIDYKTKIKLDMAAVGSDLSQYDPLVQMAVHESYLRAIFQRISSNIKTLKAPVGFYDLNRTLLHKKQITYQFLRSLEHLTVAQSHLSSNFGPGVLPQSLRQLTIVDARRIANSFVVKLLKHVRDSHTGSFANLRLIELFYSTAQSRSFDILPERHATVAGIDVVCYRPEAELEANEVGGQPWKMSRAELDEIAGRERDQRGVRKFAGHWV